MASGRVLALSIVALVVIATLDSAWGRPEGGDIVAMADAIKYLQELDKMYGQAARPRFGKRGYSTKPSNEQLDESNLWS